MRSVSSCNAQQRGRAQGIGTRRLLAAGSGKALSPTAMGGEYSTPAQSGQRTSDGELAINQLASQSAAKNVELSGVRVNCAIVMLPK
jgi:hypothetical protein